MARVTVEDCVLKVPNRFELVMLASQRARNISAGSKETVERDNDKNPVVALREIADETVVLDDLRELLVKSLQKHLPFDDFEQEEDTVAVIGDGGTVAAVAATEGDAEQSADSDDAGSVDEEADAAFGDAKFEDVVEDEED